MNEHALWKNLSGLMILGKVLIMIASILTASACTDGTTPSPSLVNSADVARTTEMKEGAPGEDSASDAAHPQPPASVEPVTATAAPPQNALTPTLELRSPVAEPTVAITVEALPEAAALTAKASTAAAEVTSEGQSVRSEPSQVALVPTPTVTSAAADTASQTVQSGTAPAVGGDPHYGPSYLKERINLADVVAIVEFEDVRPAVAHIEKTGDTAYRPAIEYFFDVIEYLKGTGEDELAAIVYDIHDYDSEEQAMEVAVLIPDQIHDERWGDHQAIVFVEEDVVEANGLLTSHPYQFVIAGTGVPSLGNFHIDSDYNKAWLPALDEDDSVSELGDDMKFLLDDPDGYEAENEIPTITLGELRDTVEGEQAAYDAGTSAHGRRVYKACLKEKYLNLRFFSQLQYQLYEVEDVPSGLPSGTQILNEENWGATPQVDPYSVDFIEGNDAALFSVEPVYFHTIRPIPQGEYKFYWWGYGEDPEDPIRHACGANDLPEEFRKLTEVSINVVAPDDAIYEAFFDPADVDDETVGFSAENGVLKADTFTLDGSEVHVSSLGWSPGDVKMILTPHHPLAGHHIDLIALDGSVSLRLDFDDA